MFKNILVPTDGSALSRNGAKGAVALAKAMGATVTGFHVAPTYKFEVYAEYVPRDFMFPDAYAAKTKKVAERHLAAVKKIADSAGVKFSGHYALSDYPPRQPRGPSHRQLTATRTLTPVPSDEQASGHGEA